MNEVCAATLLFSLAFALYSNTLLGGFVYDDTRAILTNSDLRPDSPWTDLFVNDFWGTPLHHSGSHKSYRPICVATFRLNYLFGELEPFGYHLVNVVLHGIVSVLFYYLTKYVFGDRNLPRTIATLLFIVHPIHTEAVASVVGRAEILACLFFLSSLMAYLKSVHCRDITDVRTVYTEFSWSWLGSSMLLAVLALFSKEQGLTILGVCALIDVFLISKVKVELKQLTHIVTEPSLSGLRKRLMIIILTLLGSVCLRFYVMGNTTPFFSPSDNPAAGSDSLLTRTLTFLYLPTFNAWLLFYPATLSFDWSMEAIPLINSLNDMRNAFTLIWYSCLAIISLACVVNLRTTVNYPTGPDKSQVLLIGLSLLVLPFIPATNLFFYVGFVVAERILYIPSMGFCLLAAVGIHMIHHRLYTSTMKKVLLVLVAFFLILFAIRTYERNGDWENEEALYRSGIEVNPAKAFSNLANVFSQKGDSAAAEQAYKSALHHRPNMADAHYNLGTLFYGEKRYKEALESFQKATTFRPSLAAAHLNLGMTLSALGRQEEAERVFRHCATISSERLKDPKAHMGSVTSCLFNLGNLYVESERYQEAVTVLREALQKRPRDYATQGIYNILGKAFDNIGDARNAEYNYQLSIKEKPDHLPVIINYSRFLVEKNRIQEAKKLLLTGTRYNPDRHEVYISLGQVMIQSGDTGKGIEAFERAIQLAPNDENLMLSAAHHLREAKLYDRAERFYKMATVNAPQSFDAHANYGAFLHLTGKYMLAQKEYSKALEINPTDNVTRLNLNKLANVMKRKHG